MEEVVVAYREKMAELNPMMVGKFGFANTRNAPWDGCHAAPVPHELHVSYPGHLFSSSLIAYHYFLVSLADMDGL